MNQILNVRSNEEKDDEESLRGFQLNEEDGTEGRLATQRTACALRRLLALRRLVRAMLVHTSRNHCTEPSVRETGVGMMVAIPVGRMLSLVEKMVFTPILSRNGPTAAESCVLLRDVALQMLTTMLTIASGDLLPFVRVVGRILRSQLDRALQLGHRLPSPQWFETLSLVMLRTGSHLGCEVAGVLVPVLLRCMRLVLSSTTDYSSGVSVNPETQALNGLRAEQRSSDTLAQALQSDTSARTQQPIFKSAVKQNRTSFKFEAAAINVCDGRDLVTCFNAIASLLSFCGQTLSQQLRHAIESGLAPWILQFVGGVQATTCPVLRMPGCRQALIEAVVRAVVTPNRLARSALLPYAKLLFHHASHDDDIAVARVARDGQLFLSLQLSTGCRFAPLPVSLQSLVRDTQQMRVPIECSGRSRQNIPSGGGLASSKIHTPVGAAAQNQDLNRVSSTNLDPAMSRKTTIPDVSSVASTFDNYPKDAGNVGIQHSPVRRKRSEDHSAIDERNPTKANNINQRKKVRIQTTIQGNAVDRQPSHQAVTEAQPAHASPIKPKVDVHLRANSSSTQSAGATSPASFDDGSSEEEELPSIVF